MTLDNLKRLIETAAWFANLGTASPASGLVPVTEADWQRFMRAATGAEFGLPHDSAVFEEPPFAEMERLPTAHEESDPIHGRSLEKAASDSGQEAEFKAARLEVFRLTLASISARFSRSTGP